MALTTLLICLLVQRILHFDGYAKQRNWLDQYYVWMEKRFNPASSWHGWGSVLVTLVPIFIVYVLFSALVYHVAGVIGYYILTLLVLWYCLDARTLQTDSIDQKTPRQLLVSSYRRIFPVIFWLLILGTVGVVLYALVVSLRIYLEQKKQADADKVIGLKAAGKLEGVLDWIPLRLLGLTYALVSNFMPTFKVWYQGLVTGISHAGEETAECGLVALGLETHSEEPATVEQVKLIDSLIDRSLLVWLVVIALFTIGTWLG